jgi:DNA polymerase-4
MAALGIETGADLAARDIQFLREHFGSQADYLYQAARGIDLRRVKADRARKSVGAERTFDHDISSGPALREALERIAQITWDRIEKSRAAGRTVTLKLKLKDFTGLTRAHSLPQPVTDRNDFAEIGHALLAELLPLPQPVRLMGLTLSQLTEDEPEPTAPPRGVNQLSLF